MSFSDTAITLIQVKTPDNRMICTAAGYDPLQIAAGLDYKGYWLSSCYGNLAERELVWVDPEGEQYGGCWRDVKVLIYFPDGSQKEVQEGLLLLRQWFDELAGYRRYVEDGGY